MTGFPDDNPPTVMPFPADPSAYITYSFALSSGTATVTLHDFSDDRLYLIQTCKVEGYVRNIDTTASQGGNLLLVLAAGLDAAGASVTLAGTRFQLPMAAAVTTPVPFRLSIAAPTPLVIRGHAGVGTQLLTVVTQDLSATGKVQFAGQPTLIAWPLT